MKRVFVLCAVLTTAACAGDDKNPTGPTSTPPPAAATAPTLQSVRLSGPFSGWKRRGQTFQTTATGTTLTGQDAGRHGELSELGHG